MAVNPVTNKIYVADEGVNNVFVIDGATNTTTTVGVGSTQRGIAVDPVTNRIFVATFTASNTITVIDGATNSTTTVPVGLLPFAFGINPVTGKIYVANNSTDTGTFNVTVITEQNVQAIPLVAAITPLAGNSTTSATPSFTFTASSTFSPTARQYPTDSLFQADTWQGPWLKVANNGGGNFSGTLATLPVGFHILYAFSTDGQEATSVSTGSQSAPLISEIAAYGFLVASGNNPLPTSNDSFPNERCSGFRCVHIDGERNEFR